MMAGPVGPIIDRMTSTTLIPPRVLLADLAGPARRALAALLGGLDGVQLVGEAGGRDELDPALRSAQPDVLVIDDRLIRAPDARLPKGVRVIVVGVDDDPAYAARARALGADAWVVKDRAGDDLPALLVA
jgi:DNA-binding NarL/FixJ family response regulator